MEKWARLNFQPCLPIGKGGTRITGCDEHIALSLKAACEGAVLLKNENNLLPLAKDARIAIFGKAQFDFVKGGGGSGDVSCAYVTNIYDGIKRCAPQAELFEELSSFYREYVKEELKKEPVGIYKEMGCTCRERGTIDEPQLDEALIKRAAQFSDTAIITISRFSGEGWDHTFNGDDNYFYLSPNEKAMVASVCKSFSKILVVLNVGAVTDVTWFSENPDIGAALQIWQNGMEGGFAAARMLFGDAYPAGRLVDTFARRLEDYPSSDGFEESRKYVKYREDVFVGYRYFETIPKADKTVVYPFGYGLNYTRFCISDTKISVADKKISVTATVTNIGEKSGKEVVQIYFSAPKGSITKPKKQLAAFFKTPQLEKGEKFTGSAVFDIADMALYDDTGAIQKSAYVLEKGDYVFYVGKNVRDCEKQDFVYRVSENTVVKQLTQLCPPRTLDKRMKDDGSFTAAENVTREMLLYPAEKPCGIAPDIRAVLHDVYENKISVDDFLAQFNNDDLLTLLTGCKNRGVANTSGMGGMEQYGIPPVMTTDGPAGVRIKEKTGITTTAFPVATLLACTWDEKLLEEIGKAGALEAKENNLFIWLTPALNIHRSPLCGRNFEYYSEDPYISGKMAAAMVRGIQSVGVSACAKHFACNNKETERTISDSVVSERALREIYLRGFEICVKEAAPDMIMTSYNKVNGIYSSENGELLEGILRGEWGFSGMVTTDWVNYANHIKEIAAGNDIKMPCESFKEGEAPRSQLIRSAKRVLGMILKKE